jgi:hypothetical protein
VQLLLKLEHLESVDAPAQDIDRARGQYERSKDLLQLTQNRPREPKGTPGSEAGAPDFLRTMRGVAMPYLEHPKKKPPTAQLVERWIDKVNDQWTIAGMLTDSTARCLFVLNYVKYESHRDLLRRDVQSGVITTWTGIQQKLLSLVEDPVLTRYDNFSRLWNAEWRANDSFHEFLNFLAQREAALPSSPWRNADGSSRDQDRIGFVWSRLPPEIRKEVQRGGSLGTITTWEDFEQAVRNAEVARRTETEASSPQPSGKPTSKRGPSKSISVRGRDPKKRYGRDSEASSRQSSHQGRQRSPPPEANAATGLGNSGGNSKQDSWKNRGRKPNGSTPDKSGKDRP